MANDDAGERTEEATDAKREEFRKRGQVANTKELASALFLLAGIGLVYMLSRFFFTQIYEVFNAAFGQDMIAAVREGRIAPLAQLAGTKTLIMMAPVLGVVGILGIFANVIQTGFLQVEEALTPKIEKIDPLQGLKRMFSLRALAEGIKAFLKVSAVIGIVVLISKNEIHLIPQLVQFSIEQLFSYMGSMTVKLLAGVASLMIVLSIADFFFQKWSMEKEMMMTKQQVKEEHKSREGDPLIKSRIRRIQRDMANKRMMQSVPKADVIITNPTHIAIALKYDAGLPAPQVIAKGADAVAEKIKEIAREHNIPVVENKPLARTIFKTLKIGQVIPRELFVAVAEVLSYVYKLRKKVIE